jgi:hypothetical protein
MTIIILRVFMYYVLWNLKLKGKCFDSIGISKFFYLSMKVIKKCVCACVCHAHTHLLFKKLVRYFGSFFFFSPPLAGQTFGFPFRLCLNFPVVGEKVGSDLHNVTAHPAFYQKAVIHMRSSVLSLTATVMSDYALVEGIQLLGYNI